MHFVFHLLLINYEFYGNDKFDAVFGKYLEFRTQNLQTLVLRAEIYWMDEELVHCLSEYMHNAFRSKFLIVL